LVAEEAILDRPTGEYAAVIPAYLERTYWWAYVHPRAIRLFERQWLVDLILWGNYSRLRDQALQALGAPLGGRTLQIACVYGDLTARLASRLAAGASLDVVDVLPLQLQNLSRKLPDQSGVTLICGDSAALQLDDASYDQALLFFLLHEQPQHVRRRTLAEACRVVKRGGRIVIVDYHRPRVLHPLYLPMAGILGTLEPFALDLWRHELTHWLPADFVPAAVSKRTFFGGLYQLVTITC
jgi:ubiquinone/menaquinone biosynthesis C-methylase UbiE